MAKIKRFLRRMYDVSGGLLTNKGKFQGEESLYNLLKQKDNSKFKNKDKE